MSLIYILGQFAYIDFERTPSTPYRIGYLEITELEEMVDYCLTFYYHMYGSNSVRLKVSNSWGHSHWSKRGRKSILYVFVHTEGYTKTSWAMITKRI